MGKFLRPEVLAVYIPIWSRNTIMQITWWFDMLISFIIAFALVYGLFLFAGKLFPPRRGSRPRVWVIPFLFAAVLVGYPFGIDAFVTNVVQNFLNTFFILPEIWFFNTVAGLWMAGCIVSLICTLRDFCRFSRMVKALPAYPTCLAVDAALSATGLGKSVRVKTGAANSPIFSFGFIRPSIVIPENFSDRYSPEEQYAILLHECIHSKNHDTLKMFCLSLIKSVLWFDPVSKHALKQVKAEIELLCDWTALNTYRLQPSAYAALIVTAASGQQQLAPGFSDNYRVLVQRLAHILTDQEILIPTRVSRRTAVFALSGLSALLVAAALYYASLPAVITPGPNDHLDKSVQVLSFSTRYGVFARYAFSTIYSN